MQLNKACEALKEAGAKRALILPVGGAFSFFSFNGTQQRAELEAAIKPQKSTPYLPSVIPKRSAKE